MMIAIHMRSVQQYERSFGSTNKERVLNAFGKITNAFARTLAQLTVGGSELA